MNWILWTILLSCGYIYIVFLVSCLWIAKEADEKIDQLGPALNIKHERLNENTFEFACTRGSNPISRSMEVDTLAEES